LGDAGYEELQNIMPKIVNRLSKENFNPNMRPVFVEMIQYGSVAKFMIHMISVNTLDISYPRGI